MTTTTPLRLSPHELDEQRRSGRISIIDVREPMEFVGGHIPGSRNIPLALLNEAPIPDGPLVLICQSGARSERGVATLRQRGLAVGIADLEGGMIAWQAAQLPIEKRKGAPLPLMRQVQIVAGGLVLLGVILSQAAAPGWIWLSGFVGAGLMFAGISGFCGMARLLAAMPWNRVTV
ncbi:MAG: rhodanese-like domain-containing protein [Cyanobacteriota bacterium]|nr:rhodanese-like domain-containing protein [Cyanobacteriota bacterium]